MWCSGKSDRGIRLLSWRIHPWQNGSLVGCHDFLILKQLLRTLGLGSRGGLIESQNETAGFVE